MHKIRKCFPRPKPAPDGRVPVDNAFGLFLENAPPEESMVPLTKVEAKSTIQNGQATMDFELTYSNTTDNPFECSYEIPVDNECIVGALKAKIGDKEVTAIVKEKDEAKAKYDDAVAGGKAAFYAETKKVMSQEFMVLKIGQLKPATDCTITIQLIKDLTISGSSYHF